MNRSALCNFNGTHETTVIARITLVIYLLGFAGANPLFGQGLTPAEAKAISTEAYIYGFPIVENYRTMYADAIDKNSGRYKSPFNTLSHEANVFTDSNTDVVTPNADTPYSYLWMDLRTEPLVISVPEIAEDRYYSIQLIDLFTFNFDYIGTRTTGRAAGHYLIAGPGWKGDKPDGIDKVIRCETEFASAIYRTQLLGSDDLENVKRIQGEYQVQELSQFLGSPQPTPAPTIEFQPPVESSDSQFSIFDNLNFILQFCPTNPAETELMKRFSRIGVGGGRVFDASSFSPEVQQALIAGIAEGVATITSVLPKANSADIYGSRAYLKNDYLKRAAAAKAGLYGNSKEEAMYQLYLTDAAGNPLDGSKQNYVLNFAADQLPPVKAFWSITMYDKATQNLVANSENRHLVNSQMLDDLKRHADGGLSLFVQAESPGDEKAANWLPAPDKPFYLVMRLYQPDTAALGGAWSPPLVWPEEEGSQQEIAVPEGAGTAQEVKPTAMTDDPKPELERPTIWGEPTEVKIGVFIIDVDEVNTADQSFAASTYIMASWNNPLLRHKGPGPMHRGINETWNPRLTILGQQNVWRSYPESVEIEPDGTVIYRQKLWGHFSQPMDLHNFPMDQQTLRIHVVAAGLMQEQVKMVPLSIDGVETSNIADSFSVPDFKVVKWEAHPQPYYPFKGRRGTAGYQMELVLKRSPTYFILKVIVPLCLIVIMSWLPRWIDAKEIGTNIGISTTAFLTLVAYLFAITVLLPRVSYITRIDRFILSSTLLVFISLIQTVANTSLIRRNRKALVERIEVWSRFIYPTLLAIVLLGSFWF